MTASSPFNCDQIPRAMRSLPGAVFPPPGSVPLSLLSRFFFRVLLHDHLTTTEPYSLFSLQVIPANTYSSVASLSRAPFPPSSDTLFSLPFSPFTFLFPPRSARITHSLLRKSMIGPSFSLLGTRKPSSHQPPIVLQTPRISLPLSFPPPDFFPPPFPLDRQIFLIKRIPSSQDNASCLRGLIRPTHRKVFFFFPRIPGISSPEAMPYSHLPEPPHAATIRKILPSFAHAIFPFSPFFKVPPLHSPPRD